jgi:hypothetical protein
MYRFLILLGRLLKFLFLRATNTTIKLPRKLGQVPWSVVPQKSGVERLNIALLCQRMKLMYCRIYLTR